VAEDLTPGDPPADATPATPPRAPESPIAGGAPHTPPPAEPGTALEHIEPVEIEVVEGDDRMPVRHVAQVAEAHRHRRRFSFIYLLLAVFGLVVVAAIAGLVAIRPGTTPAWSLFVPKGSKSQKADAIAAYIAPQYHLDSGQQIVLAQASPPVVQNIPIELIAIVKVSPAGTATGGYTVIDAAHSFAYELCGLGDKCAIKSGTPSVDRERLLRREGLELALYTFKYVSGTNAVVVYMPPPAGKDPTIALLFLKSEYQAELDRPLADTLPNPVPTPTALASMPQKAVVEDLTATRRYGFSFTQLQDGNVALVLDSTKLAA
jgi:hypothetical protein